MGKYSIHLATIIIFIIIILANFVLVTAGISNVEVYFQGKNGEKLQTVIVDQGEETIVTVEITNNFPGITLGSWQVDGQIVSTSLQIILPGTTKTSFTYIPDKKGKHTVSYSLLAFKTIGDDAALVAREVTAVDKEKIWSKIRQSIQDAIQRQQQVSQEIDKTLREILASRELSVQEQQSVIEEFSQLSLRDKLIITGLFRNNISEILKNGISPKVRTNLKQKLSSVVKFILPNIFGSASGVKPEIMSIEPFFKKGDLKSLLDKTRKWEKDTPYGVAGNNIYVFGKGFNKNCKVWLGTSPGQGQQLETKYVAGLLVAKIPEKIPTGEYYVWVTKGSEKSNAVQIKVYGNAYILRLTRGLCIKESKWDQGTDSDEVYFIVVVTTGEYYWAYRSQVIENVDSGDAYPIQLQFFGFEGKAFVPYDTVYIDIYAYEADSISEEVEEFIESTVKAAALASCFVAAAVSSGVTAEACVLDSSAILGVGGVVAELINSALKISDNDDFIQHKRIALTLEDLATKASSRKPFIRFDLDGGSSGKHALEISIEEFRP